MTLRLFDDESVTGPPGSDHALMVQFGRFHPQWGRRPEMGVPAADAPQDEPLLHVWRSTRGDRSWVWVIRSRDGRWLDGGTASTHGTVLREGLAAMSRLEQSGD